jgi:hypothetical protein
MSDTSQAVTIYNQISDPMAACRAFGLDIARSQIFGCQNEHQGVVLAMECFARKCTPFDLATKYDIIQGKLSMKADAMLAGFEEAGGEYEVKEYSPNACEVTFKRGKSSITIRITWDEAQKESWPWMKDKKTGDMRLKDNWETAIGRQDMMWARVVSRGVRRLAPGVVCGRYTPEEIVDFGDAPQAQAQPTQPAQVKQAEQELSPPPSLPVKASEAKADVVIDAEYTIVGKSEAKPEPSASETQHQVKTSERCSETQVKEIKEAMAAAKQVGMTDIVARVREKLEKHGLKLADLSIKEADILLDAIKMKTLDKFFELSLTGYIDIPF